MVEQLKRFQFFTQETIIDKPPSGLDVTIATLNDIEISQNGGLFIEPKLYFCSRKKCLVYIYENSSVLGSFSPYSDSLVFIEKTNTTKDGFLVTFGLDLEGNLKSSYIKIWDPEALDLSNKNLSKIIKMIKII